jgi:hypothetical protein
MELIKNSEDIIVRVIVSLFALIILNSFVLEREATCDNSIRSYNVIGIWKLDVSKTIRLRIKKGVPWHVGDKYGIYKEEQIIRGFENGDFYFYDEKRNLIIDRGKFQFVESLSNNGIVVRILPADNRYNINDYKVKELVQFSELPGDNVPCLIGFKFIDNDTVESFSYVRDFGKNKMIRKDDNAIWKRIPEIPKTKQKGKLTKKKPISEGKRK